MCVKSGRRLEDWKVRWLDGLSPILSESRQLYSWRGEHASYMRGVHKLPMLFSIHVFLGHVKFFLSEPGFSGL